MKNVGGKASPPRRGSASGWQYTGDAVTYTITVPCNLTAEVTLPDGRNLTLQPGIHTL